MNILMVHPHDIYSPVEPWTVRTYLANELTKMGHSACGLSPREPSCGTGYRKRRPGFSFKTIP